MNPHQVDAALLPYSTALEGVMLADEVGLGRPWGKSSRAKWAEQKRRILLVVPASLRKQWAQELSDKFSLPANFGREDLS